MQPSTKPGYGLQTSSVDLTLAAWAWLTKMEVIVMPLRTEIEYTRQKRKALHMLILSGVVRPIYAKLRYAIPLLNSEDQSSAFQEKPIRTVRPSSLRQKFFELMSWPPRMRSLGHPHAQIAYTFVHKHTFFPIKPALRMASTADDHSYDA